MKSPYLPAVIAALGGFAIAWFVKPAPAPASAPVVSNETAPAPKNTRSPADLRSSTDNGKRPKEVKAGDFPLADQAELGPKTREEGKMLRLSEALGLSIEQQGGIIKLVEEVQATSDGNVPVIQDLTTRGKAVEEGLAKLLKPEQLAKFEELRVRERENRIEARVQKMLTPAIEDIDLSPAQREDVLQRLRQKSRMDLQAIPAAATLLFDKSMLPTNNKELSADGILLLAKVGDEVISATPAEGYQKVLDNKRAELEQILECFDGILTPAQMGQYQAAIAETQALIKALPKTMREEEPEPQPEPAKPVVEEIREPIVGSPDDPAE